MSRGEGALAGVRGTTAIALRLDGLPLPRSPITDEEQDIELDGLAFDGSFVIGRRRVFHLPHLEQAAGLEAVGVQ